MSQAPEGWAKETLLELASLSGVSAGYHDIKGELQRPSVRALLKILTAMGHEDIEGSLRELRARPFNRFIEPVLAVFEDEQPVNISLHIPCPEGQEDKISISLSVAAEDGTELETRTINGAVPSGAANLESMRYITVDTVLDIHRDYGYYDISAICTLPGGAISGRMLLIIAPRRCHMPDKRTWGVTLSLYGIRSRLNWGVGDLGDLRVIMEAAGALGAGFVGINPLHATPGSLELGISPYQPISRLYRNFIYVDPSELPEREEYEASGTPEHLRESGLVDYDGVGRLKLIALRESFDKFMAASGEVDDQEDFQSYCQMEGRALEAFATYMALAHHMEETGASDEPEKGWKSWPEQFHDPGSPAVFSFREENEREVLFYKYIQWMLNRQLSGLRDIAPEMDIGLYGDLAVGSSSGGSDAWSFRKVFAEGMNMGAPPDDFSPFGQNWLFPPLIPEGLRESGYTLFRDTLRSGMQHLDALRIDHALGLFRAFWIPEGMGADEGTYVTYPHDELLKIIAIESARSGTVIIAEDLGTVGQNAQQTMASYGMLSYRLLYFERNWQKGTFLPPKAYPVNALAAINTHDLPSLRGFLEASDIRERHALGLYMDEAALEGAIMEREVEKHALLKALAPYMPKESGGPESMEMADPLIIAAHSFIAESPSLLAAMSLDDALALNMQQNLPGVDEGHPNWRRKYPVNIEDLFGPNRKELLLDNIARLFRDARG